MFKLNFINPVLDDIMADDDRIARAAQRFFDTITFTLKLAERPEIEGIKNYKEEKKDEKEVKDKSNL